jgi:phosphinothricin acetyltransferase
MAERDNTHVTVRPGTINDLPRLTEIYNHYIVNTPTTFDLDALTVDDRRPWFDRYATHGRHRLLVADDAGDVVGFVTTSRFHPRAAYDTTVEMTVLCAPEAVGRRLGDLMYTHLFDAIAGEDIRLAIAAITMPNDASVALHERFGFTRNALLPEAGRKFGRYWDVVWMTRRMRR